MNEEMDRILHDSVFALSSEITDLHKRITALENYLDVTIIELNEANADIRRLWAMVNRYKDIISVQSKRVAVLVEGIRGWIDAMIETTGYDPSLTHTFKTLSSWISSRMQNIPEYDIDESGNLDEVSDIPF